MTARLSNIDIGSLQRKRKPKRQVNTIKREVYENDFRIISRFPKIVLAKPTKVEAVKDEPPRLPIGRLISFALGMIIIVLLLQGLSFAVSVKFTSGEILGAATSAYSDLNSAGSNLKIRNFIDAHELFVSAQNKIQTARNKLNDYKILTWLSPQASTAGHVLSGAESLSQAGQKLTAALDLFNDLSVSRRGVETADFNLRLKDSRDLLVSSLELITHASEEFALAGKLPLDYSQDFEKAQAEVLNLRVLLTALVNLEDLYLSLFDGDKTYLLVFENYDEMRATGGFIGTYGVLKTREGSIYNLKIASIYELEGQIHEQIAAPGPFQPSIPKWGIRDANWFADFPTTARKLLYFFEKGHSSADGVIALTPKLFEDLLGLFGPIEMPAYGVTLTSENFQEVVQYKTSVDYDKQINEPKKLLDDLAPILLNRLQNLDRNQWFAVLQMIHQNLGRRQAIAYSTDKAAQAKIDTLGYSGKILDTQYDYLAIINSNLGGTKTDLEIKQKVDLSSKVLSDGSVINTLKIARANRALEHNRNFLRVLVPFGSQFLSASGFDQADFEQSQSKGMRQDPDLAVWDQGVKADNVFIRTESGKTEFSGWVDTESATERQLTLTYILPFKLNTGSLDQSQSYSLLLQKQIGSNDLEFSGTINFGAFYPAWSTEGVKINGSKASFQTLSNIDDFWAMILAK